MGDKKTKQPKKMKHVEKFVFLAISANFYAAESAGLVKTSTPSPSEPFQVKEIRDAFERVIHEETDNVIKTMTTLVPEMEKENNTKEEEENVKTKLKNLEE